MGTVGEQVRELRRMGRDSFLKQADVPVLVELPAGPEGSHEEFLTRPLSGPLMRATVEASSVPPPRQKQVADDAVVHVVRKRPNAAFQERVGIGRTANNDIVLPYPGVSKYHAYLTRTKEGWALNDASSRNGTFAGADRVAPGEPRDLDDEELIRVGPHALLFLTPPAWVAFLEARQDRK